MSGEQVTGNVIQRTGQRISGVIERWMPSPFLFAIILTFVVFLAGVGIEGQSPMKMVEFWNGGFWSLLTFAMQMVLILATGYVLAYHPWVQRGIGWLSSLPSNGAQAVVLVGFIAMVVAWVHWGLGLIVGAVMAREVGRQAYRQGTPVHYPLLCVAGYMGLGLTWHWGLAASASLLMNTPGNVFIEQGIVEGTISTSQTIFSSYTLILLGLGIVYSLIWLYLLSPSEENARPITEYVDEDQLGDSDDEEPKPDSAEESESATVESGHDETVPADMINNSRLLGGVIGLTGAGFAIWSLIDAGGLGALNLNIVNFAFLFIGIALYTRPEAYQEQFYDAVTSTGGIILQFPFYAGIMGMMNSSGLSETMAETLVSVSTATTFPAVAWITAGFINIFVPSGGGEWTVIGGTILESAQELGVPQGKAIIAYSVGDAHTNLFQPFWALPLLGITGMRARDMFGYAVTMLLLLIPFLAIGLIFIPY